MSGYTGAEEIIITNQTIIEPPKWDDLLDEFYPFGTSVSAAGIYLNTGNQTTVTNNKINLLASEDNPFKGGNITGIRVNTPNAHTDLTVSDNLITVQGAESKGVSVKNAGSITLTGNQIKLTDFQNAQGIDVEISEGASASSLTITGNTVELSNGSRSGNTWSTTIIDFSTESKSVEKIQVSNNNLLISEVEKFESYTGIGGSSRTSLPESEQITGNTIRFNELVTRGKHLIGVNPMDSLGLDISGNTISYSNVEIVIKDDDASTNLLGISAAGAGKFENNTILASGIKTKMEGDNDIVKNFYGLELQVLGGTSVSNNTLLIANTDTILDPSMVDAELHLNPKGNKDFSFVNNTLLIDGSKDGELSSQYFESISDKEIIAKEDVINAFKSGDVTVGNYISVVKAESEPEEQLGKVVVSNNHLEISNANVGDDGLIAGTIVSALMDELIAEGTTVGLNKVNAPQSTVIGGSYQLFSNGQISGTVIDVNESEIARIIGLFAPVLDGGDVSVKNQTISLTNTTVNDGVVGALVQKFDLNSGPVAGIETFPDATTLKLKGHNSVGNIYGINKFVFDITSDNTTRDNALLTLTNQGDLGLGLDPYTFDDAQLELTSSEGSLIPGEEYFLIATTDENAKYTFKDLTIKSTETFAEITAVVDGSLTVDSDNPLTVTALDKDDSGDTGDSGEDPSTDEPDQKPDVDVVITATENSKTLSESLLGTVAFVNQGAEFIADEGLSAMLDSAKIGQVATFGAVHGGTSNYNTGSRVDVDGYTLATGMSYKVNPNWVIGGFIEAGWADSDSHVNGTKGEGDHDYYGIGFATRYSFDNNFYVDGSLRLGQASTEFTGLYAQDSAKYDSDAFYTTAHVGAGYVMPLTENINLDMYGRYVLSYLDGDKVDLHNKYHDKLDMDSTVTHAVRVGGRLTGSFCSYADWKLGLAYEHVFDGDAESAVNSLNLEVPSLEGDTGVMELGVSMRPSQNSPWRLDIGAKGYAGDREGVTGNATVRYIF